MKQTLLTLCLIIFALPSWGATTISGGNISGGKISSGPLEFFTDFSEKPVMPHLNQISKEILQQQKESLSYIDGVAKFTLKEGALQNKYDKETNVQGHARKASERVELMFVADI